MKNRPILAITSLLLLSLLLASFFFLERRPLQDRLLDYVKQSLGVKATVGNIGWRWFPLPAITIDQLRAEGEAFTLVLPEATLMLNPTFFLSGEMSLKWAKLIGPVLIIKSNQSKVAQQEVPSSPLSKEGAIRSIMQGVIPADHLRIVNGTVTLPEQKLSQSLTLKAITLTEITGSVSSRPNSVTLDLRANSPFAKSLGIKGSVDLSQDSYQIDFTSIAIDSSQLFNSVAARQDGDQLTPVTQVTPLAIVNGLNLTAHLNGFGKNRFELTIGSTNKPFSLTWQDQIFQVANVEDVTLNRQDDNFSVDIKELSFAEPGLRLHGHVARQIKNENTAPVPEWIIDLNAEDIDLAAVRNSILTNYSNNHIARTVCAIVQGGSAKTARFTFQGERADFEHLGKMQIWADAKDVPITIPTIHLSIDQASGPITIINGELRGENLSATIDKTHGTNGSLLLNLATDKHDFTLDLDLDADLQNLHDVLSQIIPSQKFQDELARFKKIKGRAQGHLRLGDELHHIKTEVEVHKLQARGSYNRLPWPFTISEGVLKISHGQQGVSDAAQQVAWEDVRGSIGTQRLSRSTGMVSWQDDSYATINSLDADLDLESLFGEGTLLTNKGIITFRDFTRGRFDDLAGQAKIRKSTFSGLLRKPEQWKFQSAITCSDLKVTRPGMLKLSSQNVEAEINQQQISFSGIFSLFDQELFLSGHHTHKLFDQLYGDLEINGVVGDRLVEWLQEEKRFPGITSLKHPFRAENFILKSQGPGAEPFLASGTIIALPQESGIKVQFLRNHQNNQSIDTLTFFNGNTQGILTSQSWSDQKKRNLLTWQGEISSETIDALFPQPFLRSGQISGAFSRLTEQNDTTYSGSIEGKDITFLPESPTPDLTIDTLHIQGSQNTINIEQADLAFSGIPAAITGRIIAEQNTHTFDLQVKAPKLSWGSIQKPFDLFKKKKTAGAQKKSSLKSLQGTIKFDIDSFDYIRRAKVSPESPLEGYEKKNTLPEEEKSHTVTSSPFLGKMDFTPTGIALQIDKSTVCGINSQGTWHFGNENKEDTISFSSGKNQLLFENALPCLGIKQSLILGPFTIEGQLEGRPKKWRQGSISLLSSEGLIKRMTLLSQIFTAVNFADYLTTWHDLPDMTDEGLFYNDLNIKAHIDNNTLTLDRTVINGKGVNLTGRGSIDLTNMNADLTFFIAPFKSLDWVVKNLPLIGTALAGPKESILTFPVSVTGNIKSPEVTALAPSAVGSAVLDLFIDTITLPFRLFQPAVDSP